MGIFAVNKVAAGYLGVSPMWPSLAGRASSISVCTPSDDKASLAYSFWNVPQMAESRTRVFAKHQFHLSLEGREELLKFAALDQLAYQQCGHQCPARLFV